MPAFVLEQRQRASKRSRADIERLIEEFELKITSVESQISALVELRDRDRVSVATLRDLIAPIHTLPSELLAEIFDFAIQSNRWHIEDAFRISQVCSGWRQVAHSTPRLWTRPLQIDLRFATGSNGKVFADGLETWLLRSAPLAVPVSLVLHYNSTDHRILDEVLSTAPRWRSLNLDVQGFTSFAFVRQLAEVRFDSLEELQLEPLTIEEDGPTSISFTVPRLKRLRMDLGSNGLFVVVPWAQLTDLTLRTHLANIALNILAQCTNLIHADVSATGWDVPEVRQILPFGHLRFLSLRLLGTEEHFPLFFGCLSAPALEKLCVMFGSHWTQARFTAFQLRTPSITHLALEHSRLTSDDLRTAIRHAQCLTHLKLTFCSACFDDILLDALCYQAGRSPLAVHLHNLFLDHIGRNFTEDFLVGMIASRWWTDTEVASRSPPVARWTRVHLDTGFSERLIYILKDLLSDVLIHEN